MQETQCNNNDLALDFIEELAYLRLKYEQQLGHDNKSDYDLGYSQALENMVNSQKIHHYPEKMPSLSHLPQTLTKDSIKNYKRGYHDGLAI
ncbi:hypothetical protein [Holzapfeliella floricola]|uniref:Uncharacterized protein n=1 Tax=Holzapfeliella floricola DSM 23037 = JCM 16512 TaxID=1423744 RepID=A0A0R2DSW3_9LACO|nr:hypothetical protein [Holzapfeliella floricola]KRN04007.1 hypothetical protein FC86_GL000537 [Holzapfeliella floricola DSM 23037 = JCM 16512]